MCTDLNFRKGDISFLLTTNTEIKKYHWKFLNKKATTDVITFADKEAVDIVISLDQASRQASSRSLSLFHEVALLICHGLLHAKGLDDRMEKDWLVMKQKEFEWMTKVL